MNLTELLLAVVTALATVGAAVGSLAAAYLVRRTKQDAKARAFDDRHERLGDKAASSGLLTNAERSFWELQEDQFRAGICGEVPDPSMKHWLCERAKNWHEDSYILGGGYRASWERAKRHRAPSPFRSVIERAHSDGGGAAFEWLKRQRRR